MSERDLKPTKLGENIRRKEDNQTGQAKSKGRKWLQPINPHSRDKQLKVPQDFPDWLRVRIRKGLIRRNLRRRSLILRNMILRSRLRHPLKVLLLKLVSLKDRRKQGYL
jgi:hypothetical protein